MNHCRCDFCDTPVRPGGSHFCRGLGQVVDDNGDTCHASADAEDILSLPDDGPDEIPLSALDASLLEPGALAYEISQLPPDYPVMIMR
jgi:hypothetical protein